LQGHSQQLKQQRRSHQATADKNRLQTALRQSRPGNEYLATIKFFLISTLRSLQTQNIKTLLHSYEETSLFLSTQLHFSTLSPFKNVFFSQFFRTTHTVDEKVQIQFFHKHRHFQGFFTSAGPTTRTLPAGTESPRQEAVANKLSSKPLNPQHEQVMQCNEPDPVPQKSKTFIFGQFFLQ
jgi:hypothetical protein